MVSLKLPKNFQMLEQPSKSDRHASLLTHPGHFTPRGGQVLVPPAPLPPLSPPAAHTTLGLEDMAETLTKGTTDMLPSPGEPIISKTLDSQA